MNNRLTFVSVVIALASSACGGSDRGGITPDAGTTPRDAGGQRLDTGITLPDATTGGGGDACEASDEDAISTVGCNGGFVSGEPTANGPLSDCTLGTEENPAGSCTTPNAGCFALEEGATMGTCEVLCEPGTTYVSTGACPTGFRCFDLGESVGLCYRDCDDSHPCPSGYGCDAEGSCVPEE